MSIEKKLKRGLAELSPLFMDQIKEPVKSLSKISILPPREKDPETSPEIKGAGVVCATFLPIGDGFRAEDQMRLLSHFQNQFETIYWLSPVPASSSQTIHFQSARDNIVLGFVPENLFDQLFQLKPCLAADASRPSKPSLVLFDPAFMDFNNGALFSYIDSCVFVMPVDYQEFVYVYQLMQFWLARNPTLRYSLLLTGKGSKALWDFIYERFCDIVSHFLGCDLGFLGWMEDGQICMNQDLLLEEGGGVVHSLAKARLKHSLLKLSS